MVRTGDKATHVALGMHGTVRSVSDDGRTITVDGIGAVAHRYVHIPEGYNSATWQVADCYIEPTFWLAVQSWDDEYDFDETGNETWIQGPAAGYAIQGWGDPDKHIGAYRNRVIGVYVTRADADAAVKAWRATA